MNHQDTFDDWFYGRRRRMRQRLQDCERHGLKRAIKIWMTPGPVTLTHNHSERPEKIMTIKDKLWIINNVIENYKETT